MAQKPLLWVEVGALQVSSEMDGGKKRRSLKWASLIAPQSPQ
jgi:hypothetical protein